MKRLLVITLLVMLSFLSFAQEKKNMARLGAGVIMDKACIVRIGTPIELRNPLSFGPAFSVGYQREINPWFSLSTSFGFSHSSMTCSNIYLSSGEANQRDEYKSYEKKTHFSLNVEGLFRPFYKNPFFKRLELGGGLTGEYYNEKYAGNTFGRYTNIANYKNRKVCPGLVGTGLFHLLENNAFDLSLRYTFTVLKAKLKYDKVYNADCYGIAEVLFGVKF